MQTKRKQTLLAGAGLLTALTLTMTACTPSKFTPGPGVPTGANPPSQSGTSTAAVLSIAGNADFLGAPLANADIKITNLATGNVIATGGGNTKTDAAGNFSVDVPGLTAEDVVRIDVTNADGALSTLMTGDGQTPGGDAPAGYHVAARTSTTLNVRSSFMTDHFGRVAETLARARQRINDLFNFSRNRFSTFDNYVNLNTNRSQLSNYLQGRRNPGSNNNNLQQVTQQSGVGSILQETLTAAFKQVAKVDIKVAQSFNNEPLSPGLPNSVVKIEGNTVTLNGETFNLDNGASNNGGEQPTTNPLPTTEQQPVVDKATEEKKGEWIHDGNISPTVDIGSNYVEVAQDPNEVQMVSMTVLLPKDNLTGGSIANLSGTNLTGTVAGSTRNNVTRAGTLTFGALNSSSTGTITLGTFGQIGTYTVTDEGGAYKVKMLYTFNETGIELVGAHTTRVTAASVTLNKKDGMAIVIAGAGASSRVQF